MSEICPKCGAGYNGWPAQHRRDYLCGSTTWDDGDFYQGSDCVQRERYQLLKRNLELEEALELLVCGAEKVQSKGYAFAQLDAGVSAARAAIAKHKETKP